MGLMFGLAYLLIPVGAFVTHPFAQHWANWALDIVATYHGLRLFGKGSGEDWAVGISEMMGSLWYGGWRRERD